MYLESKREERDSGNRLIVKKETSKHEGYKLIASLTYNLEEYMCVFMCFTYENLYTFQIDVFRYIMCLVTNMSIVKDLHTTSICQHIKEVF